MTIRLFVAALSMMGCPAFAQNADLSAAFGAREGVQQASLSPDGQKIALIAPAAGQSSALYVIDAQAGTAPKKILGSSGKPERLTRCNWVANDRLACTIFGVTEYNDDLYSFSNVVAVDADGGNVKLLSQKRGENALGWDFRGGNIIDLLPNENGAVLMTRSYVPEMKIGGLVEKTAQGIGVDRIDTRSGQARRVEVPRRDAVHYISDGYGQVRIMGMQVVSDVGYAQGSIKYRYRAKGSDDWQALSTFDYAGRTGFSPEAVDSDKNVAYGFDRIDGRLALVSVSLAPGLAREVIYKRDDVDVDGLMQIGRRNRVVGLTYATDKRKAIYFDPQIKATLNALGKAIGVEKQSYVVDSSIDENRLLIWAGSDTDPGQYYLFDRAAKRLSPVVPERPQLSGVALARVQSVQYPAADGTMIPAYLTLPGDGKGKRLPAIVLPHGGPSARDEWGFDWLAQYFTARGFAVIQPNFRGSAGYGNEWFKENGFKSWRIAVGDVADAGKWLIGQGIADPAKLTILGWSYGGYAALQAAVIEPDLFKAVVAIAPVTDFGTLLKDDRYSSGYFVEKEMIGSGPHITQGSPARNTGRLKAPVLMFHGTFDRNVPIDQSKLMDSKLREAGRKSELVIFEGLDHQLIDSDARKTLLQRSADFLLSAGR